MDNSMKYWATRPANEIGAALVEKVTQYYRFLQQSGRLALYRRAYMMYYSPALQGAQVNFNGEQGELVQITVNDFRNLLKHLHTLTTSQRPAFECRASNTDHKSDAQCILGQSLLDYYLREKKLEVYLKNAVEAALIFGEAFVSVLWNPSGGEQYGVDPETGAVIRNGDLGYRMYTPMEMVRDFTKENALELPWAVPLRKQNKFELAAKYPELADTIVKLSPTPDIFDGVDVFSDYWRQLSWQIDTDEIPTFDFYHMPSDALPQGRMVSFLSDATVLFDGPIPYKDVPVYRVSCSEQLRTPFGYSTGFDIMPIQEMSDSLDSSICTIMNAFAIPNIWTQPGMAPEVTNIASGPRLLQSPMKPEVLELCAVPPELLGYRQALGQYKEALSGINSVARGNPEKEMSGSAMALLQSMAIQFSMDLQQSYGQLLEDTGTATLDRLRVFAKVPRIAAIAGKSNKKYMAEFSGDDIADVNRVLVNMGNPIMNTTAGKLSLADKYLENGMLKTPDEYTMVLTTGRLEPVYEGAQSAMMLIKAENELLNDGICPPVLKTDDPRLHILEHHPVGNSPEARNDPKIMLAYTQHMQMHIDEWRTLDPDLAAMLGIPPPPPINALAPGAPMGAVPAQGAPPKQITEGGGPNVEPALNPSNATSEKAAKVKKPKQAQVPPNAAPQTKALAETNAPVMQ